MSVAEQLSPDELVATAREVVASNLRALMGRKKVTQTALARSMNLSQSAISRRVSGDQALDVDELVFLARFFEVDLDKLLEGVRSR